MGLKFGRRFALAGRIAKFVEPRQHERSKKMNRQIASGGQQGMYELVADRSVSRCACSFDPYGAWCCCSLPCIRLRIAMRY